MKFKESAPTFIFILFLLVCLVVSYTLPDLEEDYVKELDSSFSVPTLITKLSKDTIWSGALNLLWNDLKEVNQGDIKFSEDVELVNELNQETFTKNNLSNEAFYTKHGYMTLSLKEEIIKDIKDKFNESDSNLDNINFKENSNDYFFYSILVKDFKFSNPFDILSSKTFGITSESDKKLKDNVKVLYYNDNDYAILLETTTNDEIILAKGLEGNNFKELYSKLDFSNLEELEANDTLTISNFNFKVTKEYQELENKKFTLNNKALSVGKVINCISFKLDNEGGKVKNSASLSTNSTSSKRHFDFQDNFVMFIREKEKELPYFAIKVDNIENFR